MVDAVTDQLTIDQVDPQTPPIQESIDTPPSEPLNEPDEMKAEVESPTLVSIKEEANDAPDEESTQTPDDNNNSNNNQNLSNSENIPPTEDIDANLSKPDFKTNEEKITKGSNLEAKKTYGFWKPMLARDAKPKKIRPPKVKLSIEPDEEPKQKIRKRPKYISEFLNLQHEIVNEEEVEISKPSETVSPMIEDVKPVVAIGEGEVDSVVVADIEEKEKLWEEHDYTNRMPWLKKSVADVKVPRELVALLPPPVAAKPAATFKKRTETEEKLILETFFHEGLDLEDIEFLKRTHFSLQTMGIDANNNHDLALVETIKIARQVKWSEHCATKNEEVPESFAEMNRKSLELVRRGAGSIRTQGFSKVSEQEKMPMLMKRSVETEVEPNGKPLVPLTNDEFINELASNASAARGARSQQRRLIASNDIHEVFKFSQLKVYFKKMNQNIFFFLQLINSLI